MQYTGGNLKDIKKTFEGVKNNYEYTMLSFHKDVATYTYPNGGYFPDRHDPSTHGDRKTTEIYDSVAGVATRVATAGIASGLTPQASRWANWKPEDKELLELTGVREWSDEVTSKDFQALSRSNFYKEMLKVYSEAFVFGTACILTDFHPQRWIHCKAMTMGEYYFLEDQWGEPDTLFRTIWMQAHKMESMFGLKNLSKKVQDAINKKRGYEWFEVRHVIQKTFIFGNFTYEGIYFEKDNKVSNEILARTGYFTKPFHIFRWQQIGSEKWGRSPVMEALPDIRYLHSICRDKREAMAFMVKGLWGVLNAAIKDDVIRSKPGDIIVLKDVPGFKGFPMVNLSRANEFPYGEVAAETIEVRNRVNAILFNDLFQALSAFNPKVQTAFEISQIQDQNQRLLSPIVGNFISDLIIPQSDRRFDIMHRNGAFTQPPIELEGEEISMELTSSLSIIQQKISTVAIEQLIGYVKLLSAEKPDIIDKINYEQSVDEYADAINAPGSMVRSDDQVKELRDVREDDFRRQQQIAENTESIKNMKNLSETKTDDENALTDILGAGL
jgi:hypothetical protein